MNFADELARAVIVIGLPFANLGSRELQERMRFVRERALVPVQSDAKGSEAKRPNVGSGKDAGMELYENMCMKVRGGFRVLFVRRIVADITLLTCPVPNRLSISQ